MKKFLFCFVLLQSVIACADDDCPSAVEAAEAQNPNAYKNCDYSKSGLNGVLHRALNENSSAPVEKITDEKLSVKAESKIEAVKDLLMNGEFTTALQLQTLRYALVQKAAAECVKGFVVEGERYLPRPSKATKFELIYHCL